MDYFTTTYTSLSIDWKAFYILLITLLHTQVTGVGASKFLGVQRIFAQIFPNLPKKLSSNLCGPFFGKAFKKWSSLVFLQMLGCIFVHILRDFA